MKTTNILMKPIPGEDKLDIETCRKVLNQNGSNYSEQEIIQIRDYLYQLAEIECRYFRKWQEEQTGKIININPPTHETEESISLYPGKYRRAG